MNNIYLLSGLGFCKKTWPVWQIVGIVILILKIIIPIIIIIWGIVLLAKAVVSSDDKEISKSIRGLVKKIIAGIVIFFIPSIVSALFSYIAGFSDTRPDFLKCLDCINSPNKKCDTSYKGQLWDYE